MKLENHDQLEHIIIYLETSELTWKPRYELGTLFWDFIFIVETFSVDRTFSGLL